MLLFSTAAVYESARLFSLDSVEVWGHVRTGAWMLEHHAIPRSGIFSQYAHLAWNDSSWAFDLVVGILHWIFGLRAIPLLLMGLNTAVALAIFLLARSGRGAFWQAVALSAVAQYVIVGLQPLPYVLSICFFAVELQFLLKSRSSGSARQLYGLPMLFLLWANLHLQFVLGLMLLAVFVIALGIEPGLRMLNVSWLSQRIVPLPIGQVSGIAALSLLATCATPYGYRVLGSSFEALYGDVAFQHFSELTAMTFRRPQDYVLMLLVMMAFLALGRRRSLEVFELLLLVLGTGVAFRIQRDGWVVVLAAVGVLSSSSFLVRDGVERANKSVSRLTWSAAAGLTALVIAIAAIRVLDRNALMNLVARNFPVTACDFIASKRLPQPLFNEYSFGSFVTWYLPQYPVVVDSRVDLYGEKILAEYFDVVGGKERLEEHPMIARAGTLLLQRNSAIDKALRNLPGLRAQYQLAYSDDLADVFVPLKTDQNR